MLRYCGEGTYHKRLAREDGDLYIEGPSSVGHFIYVLSYRMFPFGRHFQKDCHYSMSQFFGIVDLKLFKIT